MSEIQVKEIDYKGFGRSVLITNGQLEAVVTIELGPRIIRLGFTGEENQFYEEAPKPEDTRNNKWQFMGGHRLWHSPEHSPRTYSPDNDAVEWKVLENGISISQKVEPWVQIKKEMEITMEPDSGKVRVLHRLINKNAWPVELSIWALSVMAEGGMEIIPQPDRDTGLLGNRVLALWPYTKMNDRRVYWGNKYIVVNQDEAASTPFKFGISNEAGWAAYFNKGNLFIKKYRHMMNAEYPDFGVSYETYTNHFMLEMETLSPLYKLMPDESATHIEEWQLYRDIKPPACEEEEIEKTLRSYL